MEVNVVDPVSLLCSSGTPPFALRAVTMKAWLIWKQRTCAFSLQKYWHKAGSQEVSLSAEDPSSQLADEESRLLDASQLMQFGVEYMRIQSPGKYIDASGAVSITPNSELWMFCHRRQFVQQDSVSLNAQTTPDFQAKKAMFYEEHMHEDAEVRLIVQGVGFFDIRNDSDDWVRVCVETGDLLVLPAGIYHRFAIDEQAGTLQAIRIFASNPKWVPIARPCDDNPARIAYKQRVQLLKGLN